MPRVTLQVVHTATASIIRRVTDVDGRDQSESLIEFFWRGGWVGLKARIGDDRVDVKVARADELVAAASALSPVVGNDPTFDAEQLVVTAPIKSGVRIIDVVRALDDAGIEAVDIARRQATLDDVFLILTSATHTTEEAAR